MTITFPLPSRIALLGILPGLFALGPLVVGQVIAEDTKKVELENELVIFDGTQRLSGVKIAEDPEDAGNQVAFWEHAPKGFRFPLSRNELDLSSMNVISLRFYSEKADQQEIIILCDSNAVGEGNYYLGKFKVDWEGWKTIVIPYGDFVKTRDPAGWHKITQILLANNGYGVQGPNTDAVYYIDDVKAVKK